jgi:hypothetical protein
VSYKLHLLYNVTCLFVVFFEEQQPFHYSCVGSALHIHLQITPSASCPSVDIVPFIVLLTPSLNKVLVPSLGEVTLKDSSKEDKNKTPKPDPNRGLTLRITLM